jgi:transketolase
MNRVSITEASVKTWSKMGPRASYGIAMLELVEHNSNIIVASADLGNSSGLERLKKAYPDRFIDVGIAEQNLIGVAAGIAKEGFVVFASSFAPFITMRACEQLRMNMGYMQLDIKAVGIGSGFAMNFLGNSHFGLEDVSIVRSIPNISVVSPADCAEIFKVVDAISKSQTPTYLRLTGTPNMPSVYQNDYEFKLGKFIELSTGEDVTIIATGSMVHSALMISDKLATLGIDCGVVNCHTIIPLDEEGVKNLSIKTEKIVTLEEHFESGGLGTTVLELLNQLSLSIPLKRIGIKKFFPKSGSYNFMLLDNSLDIDSVVINVLGFVKS